ncbi:prepilin peptidase [Peptoniphilus lacrimalis]|uniref:prepilin peptidase n=1 Tax=Peptoniphilus lacrimalis TaxID=33031 RepID=UPI0032C0B533
MYFLIFILGTCFGSFFNLFFTRREIKEDFIFKASYCLNCNKKLKFWNMIPIYSYIKLKGRCAYCKTKLPLDLLIFEITYGLIFLVSFFFYGLSVNFIIRALELSILFLVSYCDFKTTYIYCMDIIFLIILQILYIILNQGELLQSLKFALIISFIFLIIIILTRQMGLGDMQLAFVSGLFANTYMDLLKIFTLSFVSGAIFAIFLIIFYKKGLKAQMPFGPFIAIAILFQLLM